jgi:hypothetical protein
MITCDYNKKGKANVRKKSLMRATSMRYATFSSVCCWVPISSIVGREGCRCLVSRPVILETLTTTEREHFSTTRSNLAAGGQDRQLSWEPGGGSRLPVSWILSFFVFSCFFSKCRCIDLSSGKK